MIHHCKCGQEVMHFYDREIKKEILVTCEVAKMLSDTGHPIFGFAPHDCIYNPKKEREPNANAAT